MEFVEGLKVESPPRLGFSSFSLRILHLIGIFTIFLTIVKVDALPVCSEDFDSTGVYDTKNETSYGGRYTITCESDNSLVLPLAAFNRKIFCEDCWSSLYLTKLKSAVVPALAFKEFPYVETVFLNELDIEKIEPKAFDGIKNLTYLFLNYNRLEKIENGVLNILKNLRKLELNFNNFKTISDMSLPIFSSFKILDIRANFISRIEKQEYKIIEHIEHLGISKNSLKEFNVSALNKLRSLDLSDNQLTVLTGCLYNIEYLRLSNISMSSLNSECTDSPKTTVLSMGQNPLSNISNLSKFVLLRGLYLNNLKLKEFPLFLSNLTLLESLDLSNNELSNMKSEYFKSFSKLEHLHLQNNPIQEIPSDTFNSLEKLSYLNITNISLSKIEVSTFDTLLNLENLYLQKNHLKELSIGTFANNSNLHYLNLSHNHIESLRCGIFGNLYNLTTLDLSHNNLTKVKNCVFMPLTSLKYLHLENNQLSYFNSSKLARASRTLSVYLDNNNLSCKNLEDVSIDLEGLGEGSTWLAKNIKGNSCYDEDDRKVS